MDWTAWWWLWPFGWIFFIFVIVVTMRLLFGRRWMGPRYYYGPHWGGPLGAPGAGHVPAEEILRARLARGEIDEAQYQRLMELLSK